MVRMNAISRIGKKGIIVIPKKMRESLGLKENMQVILILKENEIILRPFNIERVKLGGRVSEIVLKSKIEENELEK
jgi:AbrB family looped-hinge helix DNA binding protein